MLELTLSVCCGLLRSTESDAGGFEYSSLSMIWADIVSVLWFQLSPFAEAPSEGEMQN